MHFTHWAFERSVDLHERGREIALESGGIVFRAAWFYWAARIWAGVARVSASPMSVPNRLGTWGTIALWLAAFVLGVLVGAWVR